MSVDDEIRLLREIQDRVKVLAGSADPLMASQYQLVQGRITALLAQISAAPSELSDQ